MKSKTMSALILAAALLGGTFLLTQSSVDASDISFFVIVFGAISALMVGGGLLRKK